MAAERSNISLDRGRLLNRLVADLILIQPPRSIAARSAEEMKLRAAAKSESLAQMVASRLHPLRILNALARWAGGHPVRLQRQAGAARGGGSSSGHRGAAGQAHRHGLGRIHRPVRGGRRGAGQARGSAASSPMSSFEDGALVNAGDLLYIIDSRPFEAVAEQADGQLADARAKAELAKRELDRALSLVQTQRRLRTGRRSAPSGLAGCARRRDHRRRRAEGGAAQCRVHPCDGADHRPRQPPSGQRRQPRAGLR